MIGTTRAAAALLLGLLALSLAACNTVAGIGEDIRAGGNAISRTATGAKQKL